MKVSEIGEFGLIKLLSEVILRRRSASVAKNEYGMVVDIGDDASAWRSNKSLTIATIDTLVQGVHFTSEISWRELGWKTLAVNLSDIAAMGGLPRNALVSLSLPADTEVDDVIQLYEGMEDIATEFGVNIVGGNVTSAPVVVITLTLVGEGTNGVLLTRSRAAPQELIVVTGYLGTSAAGQKMLSQHLQIEPQKAELLRKAHFLPQPRVAEGQVLLDCGVRCAIDVSDGLLADVGHICESSRVSARIRADLIPIHPVVKEFFGAEALELALGGGRITSWCLPPRRILSLL